MAFIEWEIPAPVRGRKMADNEISITCSQKTKCLTFNHYLTNLLSTLGFLQLSIKQDDATGEIQFMLHGNKNKGITLTFLGSKYQNIACQRHYVIEKLIEELGLEKDRRYVITLSKNLSNSKNHLDFKIVSIK